MANGFDRTNDGAIFPNDKKRNENSPNLTGNCNTKCVHCGKETDFFVSAWTKISKGGRKFISLAFTPKEDKPPAPNNSNDPIDFDDDIPF